MNSGASIFYTALAVALVVTAPALASDRDDVLAVVNRFNEYGNALDHGSAAALCADQTLIIDMFSPYTWSGRGACSAWMNAGDAYARQNGISDGVVAFGGAPQVVITEDRAYAAMPTTFTYKVNGEPAAAPLNSIWTYTLRKRPAGWRITGLSWGLK